MATAPERPQVTIVVLAGEDRRHPKDLFTALAPQLRVGDNVLVFGHHRTSKQLGAWRERRSNGSLERPRALPRPADYLLFVDPLVTPSNDLISVLFEGASEGVGAVAPRSNFGHGDERWVDVPYHRSDVGVKRAFLREISAATPHRFAPAAILDGPCVLVRRDLALADVTLDALATTEGVRAALQRMRDRGARFIVAENAFAHHPDGIVKDEEILVSAALIVKDEEHQLQACLEAASLLADELVIYDTGSTDGTIDLARRAGATVIEGYWDDDFARARNEALEHCRGQWILWVDADEVLECPDPAEVRALLRSSSRNVDAYLVPIDNLQGTEAGTVMTHPAARLFRRATCQWEGRLHEQIVGRLTKELINVGAQELVRITHRGYLQHALQKRGKAQRNLRTAFGDLAGGSELDLATRTLSLARSYMLAGRFEEGRELCERVLALAIRPSTTRLALRALSDALLALGRFDEALEVSDKIKSATANPIHAHAVEGQARLGRNEPELALAAFDHVVVGRDDDGFEYAPSLVAAPRARALIMLERHGEAADTLLDVLRSADGIDLHLGNLVELLHNAGRDTGEILNALRPERRLAFLPQIVQLDPVVADQVLDSWHRHDPASLPILAAATQVALGLPVDRQLVWSARLRSVGLWASCPLIATSIDERNSVPTRAIAAAAAFQSFGDDRGRHAYRAAALSVSMTEQLTVLEQIAAISPSLAAESESVGRKLHTPVRATTPTRDRRDILVLSTRVAHLGAIAFAAFAAEAGHQVTFVQPAPWESSHRVLGSLGVIVRCWENGAIPSERAALRSAARLYADQPYDSVILTNDLAAYVDRFQRLFPLASVTVLDDSLASRVLDTRSLFGSVPQIPEATRSGTTVVIDAAWFDSHERDQLRHYLDAAIPEAFRDEPLVILGGIDRSLIHQLLPDALNVGPVADPTPWLRISRTALLLTCDHSEVWLRLAEACNTPVLRAHESGNAAPSQLAFELASTDLATDRSTPLFDVADVARYLMPPRRRASLDPFRHQPQRDNRVLLRGAVYSLDSLAQVNRELARSLSEEDEFDLEVFTPEPRGVGDIAAQLRGVRIHHLSDRPSAGAVEIRHQWPPDFSPSSAGRLVLMQPWEFGAWPAEWIGPIRDVVDELWVATHWLRECAIASGIDAAKVHVVPYGIDTERFSPHGSAYPLRTKKSIRFLFVGGCIQRKGIDALLETYLTTFAKNDDVCLVVKPYGAQGVYRNANLEDDLRRAAGSSGPEIEIVDGDLSADDMARLYRSCTALTHPYRGEGFGLPIAEAMASGLPVVVTDGGACLDFASERTGWLVAARRVPTSVPELTPTEPGWWWHEPSRRSLSAALLAIVNNPAEARARGASARERILNGFTNAQAGSIAARRISSLLVSDPEVALSS